MGENQPYSTLDAFLLMLGLKQLSAPPSAAKTSEEYWRESHKPRPIQWNANWFSSPKDAWNDVPHRDFLIATLLASVADGSDFIAIAEPLVASFDLPLSTELRPGSPKMSDKVKELVEPAESDWLRSFRAVPSVGLGKRAFNGRDVAVFGAGLRRQTKIWEKGQEAAALRVDVEVFIPFWVAPGAADKTGAPFPNVRSISAGIAVTRPNSAIGSDKNGKDILGIRYTLRAPFTPAGTLPDIALTFGEPEIRAEKWLRKDGLAGSDPIWEVDPDWRATIATFLKRPEAEELLAAPLGPPLIADLSEASIKDIAKPAAAYGEAAAAVKILEKLANGPLPMDGPVGGDGKRTPGSTERTLEEFLTDLGLTSGKPGSPELVTDLTKDDAWTVLSRLIDTLDGFPLKVVAVDKKDDKSYRVVLALATTQPVPGGPRRFGLLGQGFDIPLKIAPTSQLPAPAPADNNGDDDEDADDEQIILFTPDDEDSDGEGPNIDGAESDADTDTDTDTDEASGTGAASGAAGKTPKSPLEVRLQLGKWFDGETLNDNWYRRLLRTADGTVPVSPAPGLRIFPLRLSPQTPTRRDPLLLRFSPAFELISLGLDFSRAKGSLAFKDKPPGPMAHFGLGGIEARLALNWDTSHTRFGFGVKLNNLRLSFSPDAKKGDDGPDDDITASAQSLLTKPPEVKTRLGKEQPDNFSISIGYLSPDARGGNGTLDVQLYNHKDERSEVVWIPIDRRAGGLYLKAVGIGLKGMENIELGKGLPAGAGLTLGLTGGLRLAGFELGLIGATITLPLDGKGGVKLGLEGLDVSVKLGQVVISGSLLMSDLEFLGRVTIDLPKISIGAMGAYGNVLVSEYTPDASDIAVLDQGGVPNKLRQALKDVSIGLPLAASATKINQALTSLNESLPVGRWLLKAGRKAYTVTRHGVFSDDKTGFFYGAFSVTGGGGLELGPVTITGLALGFGFNRRVVVPTIDKVASFPLVEMVMGVVRTGDDRIAVPTGPADASMESKDPLKVLKRMQESLPAEMGQRFICAGIRFTIAQTADCFGLLVAQWGNELEFSLLGLARITLPKGGGVPICFIELQILMTVKPSEGIFKLQAQLSNNSWVLTESCKLTGGLAIYAWFNGPHKGDFVVTLGGYHPRFIRPDHYPVVPRLGLNWQVGTNLRIKGELYFAVTPSCVMFGGRMEASFYATRVSVWFVAYFDALLNWSPLYYELNAGAALRVEVDLFLFTLRANFAADLLLWGPPNGGRLTVTVGPVTIPISFGDPGGPKPPDRIGTWTQFCQSFLPGADSKTSAQPAVATANLAAGRVRTDPSGVGAAEKTGEAEAMARVRGDQLKLAASSSVPIKSMTLGRAAPEDLAKLVPKGGQPSQSRLIDTAIAVQAAKSIQYPGGLGVQPMSRKLDTALSVTIVKEDGDAREAVDLTHWSLEPETSSLPASLWDSAATPSARDAVPSAKMIKDCIVGIKSLTPPRGRFGSGHEPGADIATPRPLRPARVDHPNALSGQTAPAGRTTVTDAAIRSRSADQTQILADLASAGFDLKYVPSGNTSFRLPSGPSLSGAVA